MKKEIIKAKWTFEKAFIDEIKRHEKAKKSLRRQSLLMSLIFYLALFGPLIFYAIKNWEY